MRPESGSVQIRPQDDRQVVPHHLCLVRLAVLVVKLVDPVVEAAEGAGEADVVAVVAGFDDLAVAYADDEDARQLEGAAVRFSRVGEFEDHQLGVGGDVHVRVGRLEAQGSGRPPA